LRFYPKVVKLKQTPDELFLFENYRRKLTEFKYAENDLATADPVYDTAALLKYSGAMEALEAAIRECRDNAVTAGYFIIK